MFRPLPMQHLELHLVREHLPHAALALAETGAFEPDPVARAELDDPPGEGYRAVYHEARARLEKIRTHHALPHPAAIATGESVPRSAPDDAHEDGAGVITAADLDAANAELGTLWAGCSAWQEALRENDEERRRVDELLTALDTFARLRVDLHRLQAERRFLNLRLGTVPSDNTRRLGEALGLARHLLDVFHVRGRLAYVVVIGLRDPDYTEQVDSVLSTAGFRRLEIPPELTENDGNLVTLRRGLLARRRAAEGERDRLLAQKRDDLARDRPRLRAIERGLDRARPWAELSPLVGARGGLALIRGWAPADAVPGIEARLHARVPTAWVLRARAPRFEERAQTPVMLPRPAWLQAFSTLVRNFGTPRYGEIDPTVFFTATFLLLFGMMFGDLGHGLVIALTGAWLWRRRGPRLGILPLLAGMASMGFGLLYGSVFGYEDHIPALWMSPMHDPARLLAVAAWLGVGFIALTTLLNVANRVTDRDWPGALFAGGGIAGLLFYFGMVGAIAASLRGAPPSGGTLALVLGVPATGVVAYQWRHSTGAFGERVMMTLIEAFETVMGYVSGTLSFLRVAAFGLNHVALAIAVFALADMLGEVGHGLMVIGGNVFILVIEGAIVAIQVLRLEYYEGFSRFFGGTGRAFRPLTVTA